MRAHEATSVNFCKKPDCPNEAPARGRYAGYCDEHRDLKETSQRAPGASIKKTFADEIRELGALAARADKATAKAAKMTQRALAAKDEADALTRELRDRMREIGTVSA